MTYEVLPKVDRYPGRADPATPSDDWHLARGGNLPGEVWFKLGRGRDGQWQCTRLEIVSDRPLTSSILRRIPLSQIIDRLLNSQLEYMDRGGALDLRTGLREYYDGDLTEGLPDEEVKDTYLANGAVATEPQRPARGRRGPSREELAMFAAAYQRALQVDRRHAIAETIRYLASGAASGLGGERKFILTRATANRWREACRRADPPLLDPVEER